MTGDGLDQNRSVYLEVSGALNTDALAFVIRLAHFTIRSGCAEVVLQLQALTDFPTRLFAELQRLDHAARLNRCHLQLLGLDEAIAAVVCTSPRAANHDEPADERSAPPRVDTAVDASTPRTQASRGPGAPCHHGGDDPSHREAAFYLTGTTSKYRRQQSSIAAQAVAARIPID